MNSNMANSIYRAGYFAGYNCRQNMWRSYAFDDQDVYAQAYNDGLLKRIEEEEQKQQATLHNS